MKKIINGIMYDTETAEWKSKYTHAYIADNGKRYAETLCKTRDGKYFLHKFGGTKSWWKRSFEDIKPLNENAAKKFLKEWGGRLEKRSETND